MFQHRSMSNQTSCTALLSSNLHARLEKTIPDATVSKEDNLFLQKLDAPHKFLSRIYLCAIF